MNKKINITSTALEKGIDIAKDFLDKLIMPSVEETGLLLKDQVTLLKFKNQIKMLNKAKAICEKHNISPKTIPLKLLCPLLESSGLEEDQVLQDKWAILLANMVDSEQNIQNHVFPYILSQISLNEFTVMENAYDKVQKIIRKATKELEELREDLPEIKKDLNNKIAQIDYQTTQFINNTSKLDVKEYDNLKSDKNKYQNQIYAINLEESQLLQQKNQETITISNLKEFELSNLIRLGLVKEEKEYYANPQTLEIPNSDRSMYLNVDLDIDMDSNIENILTELGKLFLVACKEKTKN